MFCSLLEESVGELGYRANALLFDAHGKYNGLFLRIRF